MFMKLSKHSLIKKAASLTAASVLFFTALPFSAYASEVSPSDYTAVSIISPSDIRYEVSSSDVATLSDSVQSDSVQDKNADCPIIVVPGIMGSRLYQQGFGGRDDLVWTAKDMSELEGWFWALDALLYYPDKDTNLGDELNIDNFLYVLHNDDKQNELPESKREYGSLNTYKSLVDSLCREFGDTRDIYFFSYDWRQSNKISAQNLSKQIEKVLEGTGFDKVDLVCHSMGGCVASYYEKYYNSGDRVRKYITCGTPYEGAPTILNSTLTRNVQDDLVTDSFISAAGLTTEYKAAMPSLSELVPSKGYFEQNGTFSRGKKIIGLLGVERTSIEKINYSQFAGICREIYGKNFDEGVSFYNDINTNGYNILASLDNSYFIIGCRQNTINAVTITEGYKTYGTAVTDAQYGNGDGTVPYASAAMLRKLCVLEKEDRCLNVVTTHGGTAGCKDGDMSTAEINGANKALTYINEVLGNRDITVTSDSSAYSDTTVIKIEGPVDIKISKNGETLNSSIENLSLKSSFGRIDFIGTVGEIKMLCLMGGSYDIELTSNADGLLGYTIRKFDRNDNLTDERVFEKIPVTEDTLIDSDTSFDQSIELCIDTDGDGSEDAKWECARGDEGVKVTDNNDSDKSDSNKTLSFRTGASLQTDISASLSSEGQKKLALTYTVILPFTVSNSDNEPLKVIPLGKNSSLTIVSDSVKPAYLKTNFVIPFKLKK